jgi:hypothetical protein
MANKTKKFFEAGSGLAPERKLRGSLPSKDKSILSDFMFCETDVKSLIIACLITSGRARMIYLQKTKELLLQCKDTASKI